MKKIVLVCNAGMSTSMLVKKMREEAVAQNIECTIDAYPVAEVSNHKDADVILLGPQVRYELNNITNLMNPIKVEAIDPMAYGMMDAKKVLKQALGE